MRTHLNKLNTFLCAAMVAISGCNNADSNKANNMADTVVKKMDTTASDIKQGAEGLAHDAKNMINGNPDSNFVVKAAKTNMAELKVLQAGLDNGTNKELKMHARMMIADHRKLGDKVKAYSGKKGYVLPDNDNGKGDDVIARLNKNNKGNDWDKAWADHMVSAHEDAISMFEDGQKNVKDDELKTIIGGALPTLHSHLEMMKNLKDRMGK